MIRSALRALVLFIAGLIGFDALDTRMLIWQTEWLLDNLWRTHG